MSSAISDAAQRKRALDIGNSFCVQAPAGSGKTELLTQRVMKLLADAEKPEQILAITFTRKAATEMRNRLIANLQRAKTLSKTDIDNLPSHEQLSIQLASAVLAQNQKQQWHLLENTARLRITTIDGLNAALVSQLPIISTFGAQPEIADDIEQLYREAVTNTLAELEHESPLSDSLGFLLEHLNNNLNTIRNLLCQLLACRDQWLTTMLEVGSDPKAARGKLQQDLDSVVTHYLQQALQVLKPYERRLITLIRYAAENLALSGESKLQDWQLQASLPGAGNEKLSLWNSLADLLLTRNDSFRKTVTVRDGFPAGKGKEEKTLCRQRKEDFLALLAELSELDTADALSMIRKLPDTSLNPGQWQILQALTLILPHLVAHLNLVFRQHGKVDYIQVSSAALDALGSEEAPTDLTLRLDYRIRHILVDEFQDTSSAQVQLLRKLTFGWEADDGRTLFIVGDGMQSCYGFRNANVGLFLRARDEGIGNIMPDSLKLEVNFRSETAIVDWVNRVFEPSFPRLDDIGRGAVRFSPSTAVRDSGRESGVQTLLITEDRSHNAYSPQSGYRFEAGQVAGIITALRQKDADAEIAILVRTRSHLRHIIPALRTAGIHWNASEIDPLAAYPQIRDLITLCRALLNLADTTAWLALLRTPWAGVALQDILILSQQAQAQECSLWQVLQHPATGNLLPETRIILQRIVPLLQLARDNRQRLPLREWLENIWIALGGSGAHGEDNNLLALRTFFRVLEQFEQHGDIRDIHELEEQLARLYADNAQPQKSAVQIMTIHKAKGLEFDHVIIPGLGRSPRADDSPLLRWHQHILPDGEETTLLGIIKQKGGDDDSLYRYLQHESSLRNRMENTRLLYIGVTRAITGCYLLANVGSSEDSLSAPKGNSLLATVWDILVEDPGTQFVELPLNEPESANPVHQQTILSRRLSPHWHHTRNLVPEQERQPSPVDRHEPPAHHNLLQKKIGDIVHYCLRLAVEKQLDIASDSSLKALEKLWRIQLQGLTSDHSGAIARIRRNLELCLSYPKAGWILDPGQLYSACEYSLSDYRHSFRREYIIDRTFVDKDGKRWIIDYKSSQPGSGESEEAFLQTQADRYRSQLERYRSLFEHMEQRPVRTALFFTALPAFYELT